MGMKWRFLSFFKNLWQLSFFKKSTNDSNYFGFFSSKLSKWKFILVSYYLVTITMCPYLRHMNSDFIEFNSNALYYYIFLLSFFNVFIFSKFVTLKEYKIDMIYNFISLTFKNVILFLSLVKTKISKIFFFLFHKLSKISYIYVFIKTKIMNRVILWKPLFKRLSYFGSFKLTRSKFNNLK